MKEELVGKFKGSRGFSTLEIMIAFAILAIVLSGVVLADFGAQYWTITSQTSNEALYKAKTQIEELRAEAKQNFDSVVSSPLTPDNCVTNKLCYSLQSIVTNISSCSKYVQVIVSWQVPGYPQSETSLSTYLTSPTEAVNLGGDCVLNYPAGPWTGTNAWTDAMSAGNPTSMDVLNGDVYIGTDTYPYLQIATTYQVQSASGTTDVSNGTLTGTAQLNAIDAVRDLSTGRTYVFGAQNSTTNQLQIIDVTDINSPQTVGSLSLNGVDAGGTAPQGWRLFYYGHKDDTVNPPTTTQRLYVLTRYTAGPELHVFDVSNPVLPKELGSGYDIGVSAYGIIVHDQIINGVTRTFAYLATSSSSKELMVLDVTDPANISTVAVCPTSGGYPATSVFLLGNNLYLGEEAPKGQSDLYAFNVADPTLSTVCNPIAQTTVDDDSNSRYVEGIKGSGPYLFVVTTNTSTPPTHGQIQIRNADPATNFSLINQYDMNDAIYNGIDTDGSYIYALNAVSPQIQTIYNK